MNRFDQAKMLMRVKKIQKELQKMKKLRVDYLFQIQQKKNLNVVKS